MILISHRGNIVGPNKQRENMPSYIDTAISAGYEVEVDVNYINGVFYLGHDTPDIEISEVWIKKRKNKIWFHCKNMQAAARFKELENLTGESYKFFCHTSDTFVLTSTNHIWVHDLNLDLNDKCIIPLLSDKDVTSYNGNIVHAVCTDYISFAKFNLKEKGLYK